VLNWRRVFENVASSARPTKHCPVHTSAESPYPVVVTLVRRTPRNIVYLKRPARTPVYADWLFSFSETPFAHYWRPARRWASLYGRRAAVTCASTYALRNSFTSEYYRDLRTVDVRTEDGLNNPNAAYGAQNGVDNILVRAINYYGSSSVH